MKIIDLPMDDFGSCFRCGKIIYKCGRNLSCTSNSTNYILKNDCFWICLDSEEVGYLIDQKFSVIMGSYGTSINLIDFNLPLEKQFVKEVIYLKNIYLSYEKFSTYHKIEQLLNLNILM